MDSNGQGHHRQNLSLIYATHVRQELFGTLDDPLDASNLTSDGGDSPSLTILVENGGLSYVA